MCGAGQGPNRPIFFSRKGRDALADKFGAPFVAAVGDVCETSAFAPEDLAALAAQQLNALAQKVSARLGLTLSAGADVRDYVAARCSKEKGAAGLAECCDKMFRALSEYCLQTDAKLTGTVTLTAKPEGVWFSLNDQPEQELSALLPAEYTGAVDEIRAELNGLVGLGAVKEYVFGLADNLQVQQRRAAAGFKTASLSMHMIFTGNPGTGKTTIARLVAKYLKAIGALKGGQLVEVTRADLVGRYTGHTAPLTNSVIESALGGVLFIDEAYSLYRGEQDSFGLEAIDTLVKGMEDHRDELVVVLAGYTREMEVFLTANSGLASRFPNKIEFPDCFASSTVPLTTANCRLPTVSRTRQPFRVRSISTRAGVHRSFCAVFTAISAAGSVRSASSVQAVLGFVRRSATSSTVCTPRRASWFSTAFWAEAPPRNSTTAVSFWVTTTAGALALPTRSMCTTSRLRALPSPMETAAASRMHGPATRSRTRQWNASQHNRISTRHTMAA